MTKNNAPSKPGKPNEGTKRAYTRKQRMEDHPEVVGWCDAFASRTEAEAGFRPTAEQCHAAFLAAALRALGEEQ
jgi:hypothetical protein